MKFVLGAAQLGMKYGLFNNTKIDNNELKKIEKLILQSNVSFIDTAANYGASEKNIGRSKLNKLNVITKIKIKMGRKKNIKKLVDQAISRSLARLKTKKIYGLLVHDYEDIRGKNGKELLLCLRQLKKKD